MVKVSFLVICCGLALLGCGYKGPLYLPHKSETSQPVRSSMSATDATNSSLTKVPASGTNVNKLNASQISK